MFPSEGVEGARLVENNISDSKELSPCSEVNSF
jgi:hypothetical protein